MVDRYLKDSSEVLSKLLLHKSVTQRKIHQGLIRWVQKTLSTNRTQLIKPI